MHHSEVCDSKKHLRNISATIKEIDVHGEKVCHGCISGIPEKIKDGDRCIYDCFAGT